MDGRCRRSPHRGHHWVEEIPDTDKWECRWCGEIRHFNWERCQKAQISETTIGANEYVSRQWLHRQVDRNAFKLIGEGPLEPDLNTYSLLSLG
jgi:hypothetical protein